MRRQFKPFNRGEIGKDHRAKFINSHASLDGKCRRLDTVRPLGRNDMGTQKLIAVGIGNKLDQPARVAGGQCAWYMLKPDDRDFDIEPLSLGAGFRRPDLRYLGIGENHLRHGTCQP